MKETQRTTIFANGASQHANHTQFTELKVTSAITVGHLWSYMQQPCLPNVKAKVKQSRYRPGVAQRVPGT